MNKLAIIPITWKDACTFVSKYHRHLKAPRGGRWSIGVIDENGTLRGVALCGRPVSRVLDDGLTIEINRTATDGTKNANSALYGACRRIGAAMGYRRIVTYTQAGETGVSLRAANYRQVAQLEARSSWAQSSVKLRSMRDPVGSGGVERTLWDARL